MTRISTPCPRDPMSAWFSLGRIRWSMIGVWVLGTCVYAASYVEHVLALPGLEGYEKDWSMQLIFFGLTRLPILVGALLVALWASSLVPSRNPDAGVRSE